jgi:hypothetical protein
MRRICTLVLLLVFVLAAAPAFSQEAETGAAPLASSAYNSGNITLSATVGFGYGFSLAVYPGAEFIIVDTMIGDSLPFSFGIAARGMFNTYSYSSIYYSYRYTAFGAGAFAAAHLSFRDLRSDAPIGFLENFDFYSMLGLVFNFFNYSDATGTYDPFTDGLGFATIGGFNYFFSNSFALKIEGNYWGYMGGASIGVLFKL